MSEGIWKAKLDAMLSAASRDLGRVWQDVKDEIVRLDTAERMVALCLVTIGAFYVLLRHFQRGAGSDGSTVRFAGLMFGAVALLACAGWLVSSGVA